MPCNGGGGTARISGPLKITASDSPVFEAAGRASSATGSTTRKVIVSSSAMRPIALGTIWSLRATGYRGELLTQVKRANEAELARSLGADDVVSPGEQARQAMIRTGARHYKPILGDEVYAGGGFPLIFDCVGSRDSIAQCLRYASPRGRVVLLGCAGEISKLDLSFLWARELDVKGFLCYGIEDWRSERLHTFQITHDLLLETRPAVERLVTHVFPLEKYREALSTAANRRSTGSIKVLLEPAG